MNRNLIAPIIATGLALSSCGGGETVATPESVQQSADDFIDSYGCESPDVTISLVDFRDKFPEKAGALGATTLDGIFIDKNISLKDQEQIATHEIMHACTDVTDHTVFDTAFQLDPVTLATSTVGFRVILDGSTPDQGNDMQQVPEIEEGIVEWVSAGNPEYQLSIDYAPLTELTDNIAKIRGFTREDIVELHQNDDILGFAGIVYNKDKEQITDLELSDLVIMYQTAFYERYVPSIEELDFFLNTPIQAE
jgi:hypothetical protein